MIGKPRVRDHFRRPLRGNARKNGTGAHFGGIRRSFAGELSTEKTPVFWEFGGEMLGRRGFASISGAHCAEMLGKHGSGEPFLRIRRFYWRAFLWRTPVFQGLAGNDREISVRDHFRHPLRGNARKNGGSEHSGGSERFFLASFPVGNAGFLGVWREMLGRRGVREHFGG